MLLGRPAAAGGHRPGFTVDQDAVMVGTARRGETRDDQVLRRERRQGNVGDEGALRAPPVQPARQRQGVPPAASGWREAGAVDNLFAVSHLILYTTSACSACEEALERILALGDPGVRTLVTRDVADDERLFERYAARVPVLSYGGVELDWPFAEGDMRRLLHGG